MNHLHPVESAAEVPAARPFRTEQRLVALGMAGAVMVTVAVLLLLVALQPFAMPDLETPGAKLAYAARLDAPLLACLGAAIANVARLRFFSAMDIGGGAQAKASPAILRAGAILQNTLEQVVFAVGSHCALASQLSARWVVVLPGLAGLFCAGRALFWLGYRHGGCRPRFRFRPDVLSDRRRLRAASLCCFTDPGRREVILEAVASVARIGTE